MPLYQESADTIIGSERKGEMIVLIFYVSTVLFYTESLLTRQHRFCFIVSADSIALEKVACFPKQFFFHI